MTTKTDEQERADFEAWAGVEYRHAKDYTKRDYYMGLAAWTAGRAALQSQEREDGFTDGVLLALQVITSAGNAGNSDHDELIRCAGIEDVVRRAIDQDMWELAGLDRNEITIKERRRIEGGNHE